MSIQQIFALITGACSIVGLYGALQENLIRGWNVGPGAAPLAFSIVLLLLSAVFFWEGRKMKKLDWGKLIKFPNAYGVGFYLCVVLMVVLMYCVGTIPAILVFSITATLFLKRLPLKKNLIFSTLWTTSLYIVFVVLLQIRFEPGLLLK